MEPTHLPRELDRWLAGAPAGRSLPLPGDAWERRLLVALADHVERQLWVSRVVEENLSADRRQLASDGGFGHPEHLPQHGAVPGLPGWTYFFHGVGCCLTHDDGTAIDVDFDERGGDSIDPYFFGRFLATAAAPTRVDALLRLPEPLDEAWMVDMDGLLDRGLVEGAHRVRLTDLGHRWAAALAPVMHEMLAAEPARRQQLALALGDLELASDVLSLAPAWQDARREALASRADRMLLRLHREHDRHALLALALVDPERARGEVTRVLADDPLDGLTSTALRLVEAWGPPYDEDALLALAQRASSRTEPPYPHVRGRCLDLLVQTYRADTLPGGLRRQLLDLLAADGGHAEATLALLHHLLDPVPGLARLGRALVHRVPLARHEAAACLVVLGTAQAAALLRAAIGDEARLALSLLRGDAPGPPPEPIGETIEWRGQPRKVYSFDEIAAAHLPGWLRASVTRFERERGPLLARWWAH